MPAERSISVLIDIGQDIFIRLHTCKRFQSDRRFFLKQFFNGNSTVNLPTKLHPQLTNASRIILNPGNNQEFIAFYNQVGIGPKVMNDSFSSGSGDICRNQGTAQITQCPKSRNKRKNLFAQSSVQQIGFKTLK